MPHLFRYLCTVGLLVQALACSRGGVVIPLVGEIRRLDDDHVTLGEGSDLPSTEKESSDLSAPDDGMTMPKLLNVTLGPDIAKFEPFKIKARAEGQAEIAWSVTRGVATNVTFGSPQELETTVNIVGPGAVYTFRATVTDTAGTSKFDEIVVKWGGDHYAFTTSLNYSGDLGGLTGADAKCAERAKAGGLKGRYVALISTSTVNAKDRVRLSGRVLRIDGVLIAGNARELWDGNVANKLEIDEFGKLTVADSNQSVHQLGFLTRMHLM